MACKGICPQYATQKPLMNSRYDAGQKRCNTCAIFINYTGVLCPCCNVILRTHPKSKKSRTILHL